MADVSNPSTAALPVSSLRRLTPRLRSLGLAACLILSVAATGVGLSGSLASAAPAASISIAKSASVSQYSSAGTLITYSYLVTNTGPVSLTNATVTDPMAGLSAINCGSNSNVIPSLAPGASVTCTATYTTTLSDMSAGSITNSGSVVADSAAGEVDATSSVSLPAVQVPALAVDKTASVTGFSAAGQTITYSYTITNTGNVTLTNVTVTDPMAGLSDPIAVATPT